MAFSIQEIGNLVYRELTVDIVEFDKGLGNADLPDPLMNSHKLSRFYPNGAGDCIYSLGKLLTLEAPMVVSPAILARSTAEYCARAYCMSSIEDSPMVRVSKMWNLTLSGLREKGFEDPKVGDGYGHLQRHKKWKDTTKLPKVESSADAAKLIDKLAPDFGRAAYSELSDFVHANSVTVGMATIASQERWTHNAESSWHHTMFAAKCSIKTGAHVAVLRGERPSSLTDCASAYDEAMERNPGTWRIEHVVPNHPSPKYRM